MKVAALSLPVTLALFAGAKALVAAPSTSSLAVCSNPGVSCNRSYKTFAPYELGLILPKSIRPNTTYRSVSFYAVLLKVAPSGSDPSCDGGEFSSAWENERKRVQKLFPERKVFADHQCPDMSAVSYTMDGKLSTIPFIAVYGGATSQAAKTVLNKVKSKYPSARIKPMQVAFEQIMQ